MFHLVSFLATPILLPLICSILIFIFLLAYPTDGCLPRPWKHHEKPKIEAFVVNLERSKSRMQGTATLLKSMNITHHRVPAFSVQDIYIPFDIKQHISRNHSFCVMHTKEKTNFKQIQSRYPRKYYIKGLCGSQRNNMNELACTSSHLMAINRAVYSKTSSYDYSLILEDDGWTPFDIDFGGLISSVPDKKFGILQLINSREDTAKHVYQQFRRNGTLWMDRTKIARWQLNTYSAGAYIINRRVMKPIIDKIFRFERSSNWTAAHIVAGTVNNNGSCIPTHCCTKDNHFRYSIPDNCFFAPGGYQSDSLIFAAAKTYVLTFPLFLDGIGSTNSTIHTEKAAIHAAHFKELRSIVNHLSVNSKKLPGWLRRSCPTS